MSGRAARARAQPEIDNREIDIYSPPRASPKNCFHWRSTVELQAGRESTWQESNLQPPADQADVCKFLASGRGAANVKELGLGVGVSRRGAEEGDAEKNRETRRTSRRLLFFCGSG